MPNQRGLVPPAIALSTIGLVACSVFWGALGVVSLTPQQEMTTELHRYCCIMLATATICTGMVNLTARIIREIRKRPEITDGGYADGYADGLAAGPVAPVSPAVRGLVRTPR